MQRRSLFPAIIVCVLAAAAFTNAALAQSPSSKWKRWDWSVLYPGDVTSSTAAYSDEQVYAFDQSPKGQLEDQPFAEDTGAGSIAGFGKCKIASVAGQFSRGVRWSHLQLLQVSGEFQATWDVWAAEIKLQAELVGCAKAALLDSETRRQAQEYWSYYEDRNRWLQASAAHSASGNHDSKPAFAAQPNWLDFSSEFLFDALCIVPGEQISDLGSHISQLADRTALLGLDWNERLADSVRQLRNAENSKSHSFRLASATLNRKQKQTRGVGLGIQTLQCCEAYAAGAFSEAQRAIVQIENAVSNILEESVAILSLLPVEAIGYVFGD